jgi:citronellol/citronellal dehydrogenase
MADLKGKTLFISGGSRGIGLAIALRAARDGANVVIAAKTVEAHPKLPGTIYTAAEEIEAAGGKALPIQTDIREEDQVMQAVEAAVERFGGIDILVNNASAISLTGTLETPMKRFDLMMGINLRGTYLCSRACLPHLKRAANPHILTLSPPLNLNPRWFGPHVVYTIAKYGMSMCVLGMAEEFRGDRIAVNALWPRTTIATAALQIIPGARPEAGRTPEIMADAAHRILTRDSGSLTGRFLLDEDVLREAGVVDFDRYAVKPGEKLRIDLFLDERR